MFRRLQFGVCLAILIAVAAGLEFFARRRACHESGSGIFPRASRARARLPGNRRGRGGDQERFDAGRYYVLAAPAKPIAIYQADGKRIGQIPNANSRGAKIVYAQDIDVDSKGRLFVADRGANSVKIFEPDGSLDATIPVAAPMSIVALSGGEFAVAALRSAQLVSIFDAQGKLTRSFGEVPRPIATGSRRNQSLSSRPHLWRRGRAYLLCIQ